MPRSGARKNAANNNKKNNNDDNNNNMWRTQVRSPRWHATKSNRGNHPVLGEVRMHRRSGLLYVYELYSVRGRGERVGWLRYDTWTRKQLMKFPLKMARPRDLVKLDRKGLGLPEGRVTLVHTTFK